MLGLKLNHASKGGPWCCMVPKHLLQLFCLQKEDQNHVMKFNILSCFTRNYFQQQVWKYVFYCLYYFVNLISLVCILGTSMLMLSLMFIFSPVPWSVEKNSQSSTQAHPYQSTPVIGHTDIPDWQTTLPLRYFFFMPLCYYISLNLHYKYKYGIQLSLWQLFDMAELL